jgi:hypothetical protein
MIRASIEAPVFLRKAEAKRGTEARTLRVAVALAAWESGEIWVGPDEW